MKLLIKNAKIVSSSSVNVSDILIIDEKIIRVEPNITDIPDIVIDADNQYVFPGFIDSHTHFQMNAGSFYTADTFETGTKAAIMGGTTTIINFADQEKGNTLLDTFNSNYNKAINHCACDYKFHVSVCDWNSRTKSELYQLKHFGVSSYKAYMAYDDSRLRDNELFELLQVMKEINGFLGVHCENGDLVNTITNQYISNGQTAPVFHPYSRPAAVEAEAISRLLYIAKIVDLPVNIVHLSTKLGLNEIRKARCTGQKVFVETCPHYLLLNDSLYSLPDFESAKYVCSPPLRTIEDSNELWTAIANKEIQTIATDHCSFNFSTQKIRGLNDFSKIPNGMPGVETRASLIYTYGVKNGLISVMDMCALLSENGAKQYGLFPQKGVIQAGSDADLVIWGDENSFIHSASQYQNVDYTPYEGYSISGRPRLVLLRGSTAVSEYKYTGSNNGKYIPSIKS